VFTTLVVGWRQPTSLYAQDVTFDRKVKIKVAPVYPEIARRMGLSGSVKLEVVIAPNGTVKETKVIGGHPILVNAALDAVKKWKFETGTSDSTGTLEFKFEPGT
jgi:TonB family protein